MRDTINDAKENIKQTPIDSTSKITKNENKLDMNTTKKEKKLN